MPMMNILCPGHPFGFSVLGSVVMASALLALNVKHSGTCYIFPDNLGDLKKKIAKHSREVLHPPRPPK